MDSLSTVGSISYGQAILWCLYPFGVLIGLELFLRALDGDDDDDDPEGGVMMPAYAQNS
ncbi:hypothetical protein [Synechococcus phage metaG-MbCM1]|jgi:hypothetical protein|uniref:Uncharacterized protein n=1 Tax=Synechococcus phage metaG-MbCM1 TaxID=1079999 RepID=H8ZNJ8_9CAUD|nr:hypothetical protein [Synechococcus phage metaG-MbCM1]AFD03059.1 hypothetical protein [Synechococcus phage metaG-MbCM1]